MRAEPSSVGVSIRGHEKAAIAEIRVTILAIMKSSADESTKVAALRELKHLCALGPVSISGCNISIGGAK